MNKREKEVIQLQLEAEEDILAELEKQYKRALKDIEDKIKFLQTDELTQSRIYQIQYQQALKGQIEGIIEKLHSDGYTSLQQFLNNAYTDAFVGTAYDLAGQGIPLIMPIDQNAAVKAIITDSKIKEDLYTALGVDAKALKKSIRQEITRGIASGMHYQDIARNIKEASNAPLSRAKTIARTESHRIQQASTYDAQKAAKARGADVVKMWDSTLDGRTRSSHKRLDGQIREVEEDFEMDGKKAKYPGEFGDPAEDCNCRCVSLTRAKWALDEHELEELKSRAKFFALDKSESFDEFRERYLAVTSERKTDGQKYKVLHGTHAIFDEFDFEMTGSATDGGLFGRGAYFTSSKSTAERYARDGGIIKSVELTYKNPLEVDGNEAMRLSREYAAQLEPHMDELLEVMITESYETYMSEIRKVQQKITEEMFISKGYDGMIINWGGNEGTEYVAFENNAIFDRTRKKK